MSEKNREEMCASFSLSLSALTRLKRESYLYRGMVKLIHKLLIQYYFGEQNLMSYAISIFLFNLIEAIIELILFYVFTYCGLL